MLFLPWAALGLALLTRESTGVTLPRGDATTAVVGPAVYRPLYVPTGGEREIAVQPFRLDREPVTNDEFLAFVRVHPEWWRDRAASLLVDDRYLARWAAPDALGPGVDARQPVVEVSWFAARSYCAARGMRLPTRAEWEVAALASNVTADASSDAAWKAHVLDLYTRPSPAILPRVGQTPANFWGIRDLHGLVWEWVDDFDAFAGAGDDASRLCAAGGPTDGDKKDFAAFEREAMRGALRAPYTTANLGFRCAADDRPAASPNVDELYSLHAALQDEHGKPVPVDLFRGHPVIVSMFYGSCPSACPLLVSNIGRLDARLPAAARTDTRVLLVSFDREHDTADALSGIAAAHRLDLTRWALASASDVDARALASTLGISYHALPAGGFAHTSVIVAFDRTGRLLGRAEGADPDLDPLIRALVLASR